MGMNCGAGVGGELMAGVYEMSLPGTSCPAHPRVFSCRGQGVAGGSGLAGHHLTCAHPCPCRQPDTEGIWELWLEGSSYCLGMVFFKSDGGSPLPMLSGISLWHSVLAPTTMPSGGTCICPAPCRPGCPSEACPACVGTCRPWSRASRGGSLQPLSPESTVPRPVCLPMGQAFSGSKITSGDKPDHPLALGEREGM